MADIRKRTIRDATYSRAADLNYAFFRVPVARLAAAQAALEDEAAKKPAKKK